MKQRRRKLNLDGRIRRRHTASDVAMLSVFGRMYTAGDDGVPWYTLRGRQTLRVSHPDAVLADLARGGGPYRVRSTRLHGLHVSTVFLPLGLRMYGQGAAVMFETMVFGQSARYKRLSYPSQERYLSWKNAVAGHKRIVREILASAAYERLQEKR